MSEYTLVCSYCGLEKERFLFTPCYLESKHPRCRACEKELGRRSKGNVAGRKGWTRERMTFFRYSKKAASESVENLPKQLNSISGGSIESKK